MGGMAANLHQTVSPTAVISPCQKKKNPHNSHTIAKCEMEFPCVGCIPRLNLMEYDYFHKMEGEGDITSDTDILS